MRSVFAASRYSAVAWLPITVPAAGAACALPGAEAKSAPTASNANAAMRARMPALR